MSGIDQGVEVPGACVQVEMHAHWRNDRVLKWCDQQGIHVSAYAPLSSPVSMANMEKDVPNLMEVHPCQTFVDRGLPLSPAALV